MTVQFRFMVILVVGYLSGAASHVAAQGSPASFAAFPAQHDRQAAAEPSGASAISEVPAGQVSVVYENGQLSIKAHGVALLEVLRAACSQIGAQLEAPPGASEPVFVEIGPGPARAVLTSLLTGSSFNYMVEAAENDENRPARLIVMPMSGGRDFKNESSILKAEALAPTPVVVDVAEEKVDPKESVAQMKDLLLEAKSEVATLGTDDLDPAVRDGAARLIGMLESSMDSLAANISDAKADQASDQPAPSAPSSSDDPARHPPRRRHR